MKINEIDYKDFTIKALKYNNNYLNNTTFDYIEVIKEAIDWLKNHKYNLIKEMADKNKKFDDAFNNFYASLDSLIQEHNNFSLNKEKIMITTLDFNNMKRIYDEIFEKCIDKEDMVIYKKRIITLENQLNEVEIQLEKISKSEYNFLQDAKNKMNDVQKIHDDIVGRLSKESINAKNNIDDSVKDYLDYIARTKKDLDEKYQEAKLSCSDIVTSVDDLKNDVHRNKLSKYFSDEQAKLKGAFSNRQFICQYWGWLGGTFLGMLCIFVFALYMICSFEKETGLTVHQILIRMPLMMILVWFTWFCSKQFSYVKQICDEYEYKYVLSESYIAYRDEARAVAVNINDEHILAVLLESVIKNIATSPVQSVKLDAHIPFSELINAVKSSVKNDSK